MDSKENKLYYFIQLELLRLKNWTKRFGEEQSTGTAEPKEGWGAITPNNFTAILNVFLKLYICKYPKHQVIQLCSDANFRAFIQLSDSVKFQTGVISV